MPHEFTLSGRDSCTSLSRPSMSPSAAKTSTATSAIATGKQSSSSTDSSKLPTTLHPMTTTTAAARKPSQLGLYCTTEKENGAERGITSSSTATTATTTVVAPVATEASTKKSSAKSTATNSSNTSINVSKHIYDSGTKTFYSKGRFLGKGGFAFCYEITSDVTGKHYAAKIVPKSSIVKPKQKNKLLQEIRIHQSLKHDNIVRLYRVFEDDENVYIIMELCENHTMMELIKKKGRLADEEAKPILMQLLAAMQYLHDTHVIHRDLKLGNLFLKAGPTVKLGDFGLATLVYGENDRKRTICGTPNYIAPEILAGGEKGHSYEVDIWSFGVIMYTVLVGQPPFQRSEVQEIYEKIKVANFDFPPNLSISLAAKDLINRLLHPDPEKRPQLAEIREHAYFSGKSLPSPSAAPVATDEPSLPPTKGLIPTIKQTVGSILTNYSGQGSDTIERIAFPKVVHLLKSYDFTSKYGLAYVVSNGAQGCFFNDQSSIVINSSQEGKAFFFHPVPEQGGALMRESFYLQSSFTHQSDEIRSRMKIMSRFSGVLQADAAECLVVGEAPSRDDPVFLVRFFKSPQATFFRLSNRILQVNFYDNCRLIFSSEGRQITFVDAERRCLSFPFTTSRVHLTSGITGKLQYVLDIISSVQGSAENFSNCAHMSRRRKCSVPKRSATPIDDFLNPGVIFRFPVGNESIIPASFVSACAPPTDKGVFENIPFQASLEDLSQWESLLRSSLTVPSLSSRPSSPCDSSISSNTSSSSSGSGSSDDSNLSNPSSNASSSRMSNPSNSRMSNTNITSNTCQPTQSTHSKSTVKKKCESCGARKTPYWREGWELGVMLCNACGIRYHKYRRFCEACHCIAKKDERGRLQCPKCLEKL